MRVSPSCTFPTEGAPQQLQLAGGGSVGAVLDSTGNGYILDLQARTARPIGPDSGWLHLAQAGNLLTLVRTNKLHVLDARGSQIGALDFDAPLDRCLVSRNSGRIYATNPRGEVFGFTQKGEFIWKVALAGRVDHVVDDPDGSAIFVIMDQRHISALDPATGVLKWESSTLTSISQAVPVRGGGLFVGTVEGRVVEYSGSGTVTWNPRIGDRVTGLGVSNDAKFIIASDPLGVQIHGEHRTLLRKWDFAEPRALAAASGAHLGVATQASGTVVMFDRERSLWSYTVSETPGPVAISTNGERVAVALSKSVLCFDVVNLLESYIRDVRHRAVAAREAGLPIHEVEAFAAQATNRLEARDLAGALATARAAEDSLLRRRESSKPEISLVAAAIDAFAPGEWTRVSAFVMNTGAAHATDIQIQATVPGVDIRRRAVPFLTVGEVAQLDFQLRLRAPVQSFEVEVRFWDFQGRDYTQKGTASVPSGRDRSPPQRPVVFLTIGDRKQVVAAVKSKKGPSHGDAAPHPA